MVDIERAIKESRIGRFLNNFLSISFARLIVITRQDWFIVAVLIIIGTFLRLYKLSFQSYWLDEVLSINSISQGHFWDILRGGYSGDPPFYEFLLFFWGRIFGYGEAVIRLLSVVWGIFTLPLTYLITKKIFGHTIAITSTFLLTFSAYHIYYSQEASMYVLFWFLTLASNILFIDLIEKGGRTRWVIYLIISIIAFHTNYLFLLNILYHNIVIFIFWKRYRITLKSWVVLQTLTILALLPWAWISIIPHFIPRTFLLHLDYSWIPSASYMDILNTFAFFILGQNWMVVGYDSSYWPFFKVSLFISGFAILSSLWLIIKREIPHRQKHAVFFILLWCFLPIASLYAVSIYLMPCYTVRYVGLCHIPFYIVIAYAIHKIYPKIFKPAVLTFFLGINIFILNYYYNFPVKTQFRELAQQIYLNEESCHTILIDKGLFDTRGIEYYYHPGVSSVRMCTQGALNATIKRSENFWFVVSRWTHNSVYELLEDKSAREHFNDTYYLSKTVFLDTIKGFLFERKGTLAASSTVKKRQEDFYILRLNDS